MKNINITLHPFSVLTGMALLGIGLIATGAFAPQGSSGGRDVNATEIVGTFNPKTSVRFTSDAPYTVPPNKLFILTMVSKTTTAPLWLTLAANGVEQFEVYVNTDPIAMPNGPVYPAGTTLTCTLAGGPIIFYGYLIDA